MTEQSAQLSNLFAKKFIGRPDVRAIQLANGEWRPERDKRFDRASLTDHLSGAKTYGHYMMNTDNLVKLFALDIDLTKSAPLPTRISTTGQFSGFQDGNPRESWGSRKPGPARDMLKYQMRFLSHELARIIQKELDIPVAVAYSGSKGCHVYGFTGLVSGMTARAGANLVLELSERWHLIRGKNFFGCVEDKSDIVHSFQQFELEVYPKQDTLDNKDLGNLMRLPLGRNLKSPKDPTFFIDMRTAMSDLKPRDAVESLTTTDPWR